MTMAGLPETVAPLGTALTEDQLAMLWRMADEPVLCFDGDKAGRKAAYRAIDVALPLIEAGRSLRFALLPEGQDPDDLARAAALRRCATWSAQRVRSSISSGRARSRLAAGDARAEGRLRETARRGARANQGRGAARHYRDEIDARLSALFPPSARGRRGQPRGRGSDGFTYGRKGGFGAQASAFAQPIRASSSLARSALFAAPGRGESPREAAILLGAAARPELLPTLADELAEIDWQGHAAIAFCQALLQAVVDGRGAEALAEIRAAPAVAQAESQLAAILHPADRFRLAPDADPHAAGEMIHQALVLHRRARTLHSELKAAERALSDDYSEANLAWLLDVKARLSSMDGTGANEG